MSDFIYPIYILSLKKDCYFKEFTNSLNKRFVKIIMSCDLKAFNIFVDKLISDLCIDDLDISRLTVFDKFYILYAIRAYNVGSHIELEYELEENNFFKHNISMIDLLTKLEEMQFDDSFEVEEDKFKVVMTFPKSFTNGESVYHCLYDSINEITFGDKVVNVLEFDLEKRIQILDTLPGTIMPRLFEHIQEQETLLNENPIIDINVDVDLPFDKQMSLSLINNALYELVKLAFNSNLKDFYMLEYTLIKKFNFSYEHISKTTPAELQVYFNVISEDLEREKKERESEEGGQGFDIPPPNNMPHQ